MFYGCRLLSYFSSNICFVVHGINLNLSFFYCHNTNTVVVCRIYSFLSTVTIWRLQFHFIDVPVNTFLVVQLSNSPKIPVRLIYVFIVNHILVCCSSSVVPAISTVLRSASNLFIMFLIKTINVSLAYDELGGHLQTRAVRASPPHPHTCL